MLVSSFSIYDQILLGEIRVETDLLTGIQNCKMTTSELIVVSLIKS